MKTPMRAAAVAFFVLTSCAHAREPSRPAGGDRAQTLCGSDAAHSPAHCECLGGYVRGDIGDGKVACPQGETELERVQQGIEGAVCCKRAAMESGSPP